MYIWEELLLVLGLSMDGFAASVCMGMALGEGGVRGKRAIVALVSGFHVAMVVLGCWLGLGARRWLEELYPWIASSLLLALGANMLRTAGREEYGAALSPGGMATLAFATSLDAFTVGVAFSLMEVPVLRAGSMTALVMGLLSFLGARCGGAVGKGHRKTARLAGGFILCILGLRLLWSALETLSV